MSGQALAFVALGCVAGGVIAVGQADTRARALFITNCAQCHMPGGGGTPGLAPPLRNRVAHYALKRGGWRYLARVITFGLSGPIEAQGAQYDGYMPSFATLPAADRATILNYVVNLTVPKASPPPITTTEIERFTHHAVGPAALRRERAALRGEASPSLGRPPSSLQKTSPSFRGRATQSVPVALWIGPRLEYARICAGCHLLSGEGIPGQVPRLKNIVGYFMRTPAGRAYLPRLPDIAYSPLSNRELAGLLNWVTRRFGSGQLPRGFTPYRAAEVGALRTKPLIDVSPVRERVLRGLLGPPGRRHGRLVAESLRLPLRN